MIGQVELNHEVVRVPGEVCILLCCMCEWQSAYAHSLMYEFWNDFTLRLVWFTKIDFGVLEGGKKRTLLLHYLSLSVTILRLPNIKRKKK